MKGISAILSGLLAVGGIIVGTVVLNQIWPYITLFVEILRISIIAPELRWMAPIIFTPLVIGIIYLVARLIRGGG